MKRDYETLDAIVVVGSLAIIGGTLAGLMVLKVPTDQLPIVAGTLGTLLGTAIGGYSGFRWGSNIASKQAAEAAADTSRAATGALAQIAGAGPQPPSSPSIEPLETKP